MARKLVRVAAALAVGFAYLWFVQCAGARFYWTFDLDDYYSLLGRAFAKGHLYLPKDPPPEQLALADPWDPAQSERFPMHDAVLFNQRYYLYHGGTPAVLLFTPWRLISKHDMTECFAAFLFCFGGYLFACALLMRLLTSLGIVPPLPILALMLLALGFCQIAPYLLQRVLVYEVAIACGYFCLSAGFYFFARAITTERRQSAWLAAAGLLLGLAIGCRPHLGAAAGIAGLLLIRHARRKPIALAPFLIPLAFCLAMIGVYNYARFGNPTEFGVRFQLVSSVSKNVGLRARNVAPGLYYLLMAPPEFEPVFPYVRPAMHMPFDSGSFPLPEGYFLEPITGVLIASPLTLLAIVMPFWMRLLAPGHPARTLLWTIYASALASILFIAGIGFSTERYLMDFLPALLVISCVGAATLLARWPKMAAALAVVMLYGIAVNLGIGVQGPYDEFARHSPDDYVRLARWFSPLAQYRPLSNPTLSAEAVFRLPAEAPSPLPLITAGRYGTRYALSAEAAGAGKWRLVSAVCKFAGNVATAEVNATGPTQRVRVDYQPPSRTMVVQWNGQEVLRHKLDFLVTAPSQLKAGVDLTDTGMDRPVFPGTINILASSVGR